MPIHEYVKKRDFKKTPEPKKGRKLKKTKSAPLMFVVQEHHASHLHYDFRLEMDGVLKSWAIPKGPSLDPKIKRLAVEVEDHPLSYGHFEGVIPKGQYGAGRVYIWDTGTWEPIGSAREGFKKGHLEFKLKGKKLHGRWMLIKTPRKAGTKSQWLLFKRSDEYAESEDEEPAAPPKKNLKLPRFIAPQLAELVSAPPEGIRWIHETKFDGYRTQAHLENGKVTLYTRSGLDWTKKYPAIAKALLDITVRNAIIDGEVVWLDREGRTSFQDLQRALKEKDMSRLIYYAFDLLFLNGEDCRALPLHERKHRLEKLIRANKSPLIRYSDHMEGRGPALFHAACAYRLEGLMSKDQDSLYHSGRSGAWVKSKCKSRQEFVIGGYAEGSGARASLGALLLGFYEGSRLCYAGRTGTGFSERTVSELLKKLRRREIKTSPFDIHPPKGKGLHWVRPGLVAEVSFANWTADGVLRSAVFHELREDKPAKEIHFEKINSIKSFGGSKKKSKTDKVPREIPELRALSNPEKIFYLKEGISKMQVARYYQDVATWMLPHIADRPLVLVRCPDDSAQSCFYQKHIHGSLPSDVVPVTIREKNESREYLTIDSKEGLLSLSQLRAFELHAWGCRSDDIEHPDQVVMDLDPGPGVPWAQVVAAALELRDILEGLRLKCFVKVSGGKGLHIHIPIAPIYGWDQIKSFAKTLGREMVMRHPELFTITMSKRSRGRKIFIDYFRNGRGATAVVPYSLRVREVSSVAMPVSWQELSRLQGGDVFTMKKAYEHLKNRKQDPWRDFYKKTQRISILKPSVAP